MDTLKLRQLLMPVLMAAAVAACANRCTEPVPARSLYQHETEVQRLVREQQDSADFAALELEKAYERMSDNERMGGVVYE
ncbi:hypothetical protein [Neisseria musculi]|uniref:Lipoprotein n=1 Tax=Neisseria musculi TaxID=1815583 RepID=A0A7H1M9I8_9NEIS|nr:hypothetical protein [Neisseria musculi]QNT58303.1 hypothetical protein H7A79_0342 [Neisseria musculi]